MKVLITGGDGFIARNLKEQLNVEFDIVSAGRQELDLIDPEKALNFVKNGRFDVVIHAATYDAAPKHSTKDPTKVLEYNLKMFFNLARCKEHFGKLIYFGSGAEFGREHWGPKMNEDYFDRHVPADQYGFSKYIMTKYTQSCVNIYNLRLFGVFGKYDDWRTRFIPNACAHAVYDLPIRIDRNRVIDFLYIDDLVQVVRRFINGWPRRQVYNVCSGQRIDFKTAAELIIKISGKNLGISIIAEGMSPEYSGENSLLLHEMKNLKFKPFVDALTELYGWFSANRHLIRREEL